MKKMILPLLFAALLLGSCSNLMYDYSNRQLMGVHRGMNQKEVVQLLKEPHFRRFNDVGEEWEYRGYVSNGGQSVIIIEFEDDRVIGMNTFALPTYSVATTPSSTVPPLGVVRPAPCPEYHRPAQGRPSVLGPVMPDRDFVSLMRTLKSGFSSERMPKIREAMKSHRFTSAQCRALVELFSFSDEKLELVKTLYPRVSDPENFSTVIEKLSYFDREKANDYLKQYK